MPHMLAQEHEGTYDCLRAGTARTQATISAALSAIGSTPTRLILSLTGDGVWTIGSNLTIPTNVTLVVPPGVTVNRASGVTLTLNGPVMALQPNWETGPGSTVRGLTNAVELSAMRANQMTVYTGDVAGQGMILRATTAANTRAIVLQTNNGGSHVGIALYQGLDGSFTGGWEMIHTIAGALAWAHPGGGSIMTLNNSGVGIGAGMGAGVLLDLLTDSARKPGAGGLWTVASSEEVKDILGDYTEGMARLHRLPRIVRFRYNGKGGTPKDGPEDVGFVAEELQAVMPSLVRECGPVILDEEETMPVLGTNLGELLFVFINALKEVDTRLTALEDGHTEDADDHPRRARRKDA